VVFIGSSTLKVGQPTPRLQEEKVASATSTIAAKTTCLMFRDFIFLNFRYDYG